MPLPRLRLAFGAAALAAASLLASCGGDGSSGEGALSSAAPGAVASPNSSGTISAFGSVFVNGQRYSTDLAVVIDDDTGDVTRSTAGLEVGMVVDVKPATHSTRDAPVADALHLHPLARGFVDASDPAAGSLRVMGQTVQVTGATLFSDRRACVDAASPCGVVAGQSGLVATGGAGVGSVPGSYVTVHGYLFAGAGASGAQIVATLVSVSDAPGAGSAGRAAFKAEGLVSAVVANRLTLGALDVDLSATQCYAAGGRTACGTAFAVGQIVSVFSTASPSLPAANFAPGAARARSKLMVETAGVAVELEGKVSAVSLSPPAFSLRGVAVDASAWVATSAAGTALPAVGDVVRVAGGVGGNGQSMVASEVVVLQAAGAVHVGLEGEVGSVSPGPAADTYTVQLLGKAVRINAATRLVDLTRWRHGRAASGPQPSASAASASAGVAPSNPGATGVAPFNLGATSVASSGLGATNVAPFNPGATSVAPFNITNFASVLAASSSKHVALRAVVDRSGQLTAVSLAIVLAANAAGAAGVGGLVDAAPMPVDGVVGGASTTFSVAGVAVSADPAFVITKRRGAADRHAGIAAGDFVIVRGSAAGTGIAVGMPAGAASAPGPTASMPAAAAAALIERLGQFVVDFGTPPQGERDGF